MSDDRRNLGICERRNFRTAWNRCEILLDHLLHLRHIYIAGNYEHGVVWCVISLEEILNVGEARRREVVHRANYRVMIRVPFGKECLAHLLESAPVRLIVV